MEVKLANIAPKDIVKMSVNGVFASSGIVSKVTKTQVHVTIEVEGAKETLRFRRKDGKEIASNGKILEDGGKLNLKDIIRFK